MPTRGATHGLQIGPDRLSAQMLHGRKLLNTRLGSYAPSCGTDCALQGYVAGQIFGWINNTHCPLDTALPCENITVLMYGDAFGDKVGSLDLDVNFRKTQSRPPISEAQKTHFQPIVESGNATMRSAIMQLRKGHRSAVVIPGYDIVIQHGPGYHASSVLAIEALWGHVGAHLPVSVSNDPAPALPLVPTPALGVGSPTLNGMSKQHCSSGVRMDSGDVSLPHIDGIREPRHHPHRRNDPISPGSNSDAICTCTMQTIEGRARFGCARAHKCARISSISRSGDAHPKKASLN